MVAEPQPAPREPTTADLTRVARTVIGAAIVVAFGGFGSWVWSTTITTSAHTAQIVALQNALSDSSVRSSNAITAASALVEARDHAQDEQFKALSARVKIDETGYQTDMAEVRRNSAVIIDKLGDATNAITALRTQLDGLMQSRAKPAMLGQPVSAGASRDKDG